MLVLPWTGVLCHSEHDDNYDYKCPGIYRESVQSSLAISLRKILFGFIVIESSNGTHRLVKKNIIKSVIAGFEDGDTIGKQ